jgi:hypothetical protein
MSPEVRDSGSRQSANYAYLAILLMTGALLALSYELLRFMGVRWLVTMSPDVVARVIRRRRRILRATHRLLSMKTSTTAAVDTVSAPLESLARSSPLQLGPGAASSSYSRTLLSDDADGGGDSVEVRAGGSFGEGDATHLHAAVWPGMGGVGAVCARWVVRARRVSVTWPR